MPYFPPLNQQMRGEIRATVRSSKGDEQALERVSQLCQENEHLSGFSFEFEDDFIDIAQNGRHLCIPRSVPPVKYVLLAYGYTEWLKRKYTNPGFCEVAPGDVVIDCGAYIGGFSLGVAETAGQVLCFEPSPVNFACLKKNANQFPNLRSYPIGLGSRNETLQLNISSSSVEHSFLDPDRGHARGQHAVQVKTIETVLSEEKIEQLDFLKIEAEGFEIEVFKGLCDIRPRKIAIDVSPERNGESPREFFVSQLEAMKYDLALRGNVLFGVLT